MKNIFRIGTLLVILLLPVLIYLFLKAFGENQYAIPVLYEDGVDSSLFQCDFEVGKQHYVPDFSFINQDGGDISGSVLDDKITVVDFFFTTCPSICPIMSDELARVQNSFSASEDIQILSITVDPENDTPEILSAYANEYKANTAQWQFLTGEKEDIYRTARCGFLLPVEDGDGSAEDFIHSDRFVLVDKNKRIRGYYEGTSREEVDRLIMEIQILAQEYK